MRTTMLRVLAIVSATALAAATASSAAEPQRWALCVGVDDYVGLTDLNFCGQDASALADVLRQAGFDEKRVVLMNDAAKENRYRPFKANIELQLDNILKLAGPDDLVIVSFSGHGILIDDKSYLCPNEANDEKPAETLIAVDDVFAKFGRCKAAMKLLLVDACRNDPRPPGKRSATPDEDLAGLGSAFSRPPDGMLVLSSCSPGQVSWEEANLGHGVFMHHVLKGLSGEADGNRNGSVTLGELYEYATSETKTYVLNRFNHAQIPELHGKVRGVFELPRAGQTKTITNTIGMTLVLLPAGEFDMGTPDGETEFHADERPQVNIFFDKPYYLGAHEVTRGQFAEFAAATGYKTAAERDGLGGWSVDDEGKFHQSPEITWRDPGFPQTDAHPVVIVDYHDALAFCEWLSKKEGRTYRLPNEKEWEYACRAGTKSKYPHGTDPEGFVATANLADAAARARFAGWTGGIDGDDGYVFPAPVGRFQPNAWGLYDMIGNVWEWCDDAYDAAVYQKWLDDDRTPSETPNQAVIRGGSWIEDPSEGRSANRNAAPADSRVATLGFRILLEK